jgi:actin, other eukaryote
MIKLCPRADLVKVIAPEQRYYSVWQGGNILSGLATFENQWITKAEYDE